MAIVTPKNAVEVVLDRKTKSFRFRFYETTVQKWVFWSAVGSLVLAGALGAAWYVWRSPAIALAALALLFLASLLAAAYQISQTVPALMKLKNIEREVSNSLVEEFNDDIDLITELARDYRTHHLQYAQEIYSLMAVQHRSHISLLVGAIDKVGLIPLGITAYISWKKLVKDGLIVFGATEWVLAGLVLLYLVAVRMNETAQWMDRMSLLYKRALSLKQSNEG